MKRKDFDEGDDGCAVQVGHGPVAADVQRQNKEIFPVRYSAMDAQDTGQREKSAGGRYVPATWGGAVYPRPGRQAVNGRGV